VGKHALYIRGDLRVWDEKDGFFAVQENASACGKRSKNFLKNLYFVRETSGFC